MGNSKNAARGLWGWRGGAGVVGAYHGVSRKHPDRYLDELEFRFNNPDNPYIFRDALKELFTADSMRYGELVA